MALLSALLVISSFTSLCSGYYGGTASSGLLPLSYGAASPKWLNTTTPVATLDTLPTAAGCDCTTYTLTETNTVYVTTTALTTTTAFAPCSISTSYVFIANTPATSSPSAAEVEGKQPSSYSRDIYPYAVSGGTTSWLYGPPPTYASVTTAPEPTTIVISPTPEESDIAETITITSTNRWITTTTVIPTSVSVSIDTSSSPLPMLKGTITVILTIHKTKTATGHANSMLNDVDTTITSTRTTIAFTTVTVTRSFASGSTHQSSTTYGTRYQTNRISSEAVGSTALPIHVGSIVSINISLSSVDSMSSATQIFPPYANTTASSESLTRLTISSTSLMNSSVTQIQDDMSVTGSQTRHTTESKLVSAFFTSTSYANSTGIESQESLSTPLLSASLNTISASFPSAVFESFPTIVNATSVSVPASSTKSGTGLFSIGTFAESTTTPLESESSSLVATSSTSLGSASFATSTGSSNIYSQNTTSLPIDVSETAPLPITSTETAPEMTVTVFSHSYTLTNTVPEFITTTLTTARRSAPPDPYEANSIILGSSTTFNSDIGNPSISVAPMPTFILTEQPDSTGNANSETPTNTLIIAESPGTPAFNIGVLQNKSPKAAGDIDSGHSDRNLVSSKWIRRRSNFRR